jgi:hypothetical protein
MTDVKQVVTAAKLLLSISLMFISSCVGHETVVTTAATTTTTVPHYRNSHYQQTEIAVATFLFIPVLCTRKMYPAVLHKRVHSLLTRHVAINGTATLNYYAQSPAAPSLRADWHVTADTV